MSPERYGPRRRLNATLDLLPRTKVHTAAFLTGAGSVLLAVGWLMVSVDMKVGELTAATIAGYRAGGWTSLAAGVVLLAAAFRQERRSVARAKAASSGSTEAWTLDHAWTPGRASDHAAATALEAAFWTLASFAVAAGAVAVGRLGGMYDTPLLQFGAALLAAAAAAGVYYSFPALRRGILFGESRLTWEGGGPLRAGSDWSGEIALAEAVHAPYAYLQFVKDEEFSMGENTAYRRRERQRIEVACRVERGAAGRNILKLSASIPAKAPVAALSQIPARYWELVVADDESGWLTAFLVPLY